MDAASPGNETSSVDDRAVPPADAQTETELKLDVPPRLATKVLAHHLLRTRPAGRLSRARLLGVYYDTPKFELWKAGLSVRLRRSPKGWIQTIKWAGEALGGLHQRNELEWPVAEQMLAFDALESRPGLEPLFDERLRQRLKPVFVTEFERAARMITLPDGSKVEASLDRGRIVCGTTIHPLCELELELKGGSALGLFDLAQALLADFSLRPAHRSKAERGYHLAGLDFQPVKARRAQLGGDADVASVVASFVGSGLEQVQANEQGFLRGEDIEYLHQIRVGVRRLRSCLGTFGAALPGESVDALQGELKWLSGRLGVARDWDVFCMEALPVLSRGLACGETHAALEALARAANVLRERAGRSARLALQSRRAAGLLLELGRVTAGGGLLADAGVVRQPVVDYGRKLLDRRREKVLRRGKKARKSPGIAHLHELRIAVKKLRYATEFVGSLYANDEATHRYRALLVKLQDSLGRICDAAVMVERVREAVPTHPGLVDRVSGWSACLISFERERFASLWRAFRRAERYW